MGKKEVMKQILEDILSIVVPSVFIVAIGTLLAYFLVGCNFIQVKIAQKASVDIGDGTNDNYTTHNKKTETDSLEIKLK
jgi:Sec-independent protein secretion pathway component TatC